MKKILISILTILGIGLSFCSADNSCTSNLNRCSDYSCDVNSSPAIGFSMYFEDYGDYSFNSISFFNSLNNDFSEFPLYFCALSSQLDLYSYDLADYILSSSNCSLLTGYSIINNNGITTVNFNSFEFYNTSDTPYLSFFFHLLGGYLDSNVVIGSDWDYRSFYFPLVSNIYYKALSTNGGVYLQPANICYSKGSSPEFKVNYGNTSYTYTLEDNLFIYLKSPVNQNGNTFSYVGSTGINLFYNGTSQFYSKSNLYLDSMYWYNNNIFTPICL